MTVVAYQWGHATYCPSCARDLWGNPVPTLDPVRKRTIRRIEDYEVEHFWCSGCRMHWDVYPDRAQQAGVIAGGCKHETSARRTPSYRNVGGVIYPDCWVKPT